eukprot:g7657.t1
MQRENDTVVMDGAEAARSPSEVHVELTAQPARVYKTKRRDTVVRINIKFCTHVGLEGVLVLLFMLIIAGLFVYVTYQYTSYFSNFQREFVTLFILMGLIYFLAVLWFTTTWKKIADDYTKRATGRKKKALAKNAVMAFYADTFINGPLFLWKLYIVEFCESINQMINFFTVYLCSLPVGVSIGICIALGLDSWSRGYGVLQQNTPVRRDRQIKIDIVVDFLCVALPILIMWFGYKVPISVGDMMQIALFPAFLMQINHGPLQVIPDGFDKKFSKVSVLDLSHNELSNISRTLGNLQINRLLLANNLLNKIPDSIWGNNYIFRLDLDNNKFSKISTTIQSARSLSYLYLSNNSFVELPEELFALNLKLLNVDGNMLTEIPEEIGDLQTLSSLKLNNNNNISEVPDSIGKLRKLLDIDLRNNAIEKLPENAILKLESSLKYIYLRNNPICTNGWLVTVPKTRALVEKSAKIGAGCTPQCSIYCQDRWLGSGQCPAGRECDSEECNSVNSACEAV